MSKKYFAFKLEAQGRLRELKTKVEIGAPSLIDSRPYNEKDFLEIQAVWDTGATATVIAEEYAKKLELQPTGVTKCYTAGGEVTCYMYLIDLVLPNKIVIKDVPVTSNPHLNSCDMLIGMDIICMGDFAISNAKGNTRFSYSLPPHDNPICLYEKAERVNKRNKVY